MTARLAIMCSVFYVSRKLLHNVPLLLCYWSNLLKMEISYIFREWLKYGVERNMVALIYDILILDA